MLEWARSHAELFTWISIASVIFFVGSLIAVGVVVVRLPVDFLKRNDDEQKKAGDTGGAPADRPTGSMAWRIGKNVLGWILILAGLAMLVLPGQGMLVLLIGVMLADFPGKPRLERWILSRKGVMKSINWIRKKFKKPPMESPTEDHGDSSRKPTAPARPAT